MAFMAECLWLARLGPAFWKWGTNWAPGEPQCSAWRGMGKLGRTTRNYRGCGETPARGAATASGSRRGIARTAVAAYGRRCRINVDVARPRWPQRPLPTP